MDQKQNFRMLSKEDFASVCLFVKMEYLSCIGVMLSKFCKSLLVLFLHHVLGVIRIEVLNPSCSKPILVPTHYNSWS
jgi:hypothetical protein